MERDAVARLTEGQRKCLRLVYARMTSKEIAPQLGIEPGSVDQHIKGAMRVLGVGDRRTAARVLAEHEGGGGAAAGERPITAPAAAMHEDQASFQSWPLQRPMLPLPWEGIRPTRVGWMKRLVWIAAIAFGCAFGFGALIAGAEAFTRLMRL